MLTLWGFSSAGRASALHAEGQEFESPNLHHKIHDDFCYRVFYYAVLGMRTPNCGAVQSSSGFWQG